MAKKNWIADATKNKGALTAKAANKGMTPTQFCDQSKDKMTRTSERQCALLATLKKMNKGG